MSAAAPAVQLSGLTRRYGGLTAVDDVTLVVAAGERVGVIGPNGAGKTTLFRLIAGDVSPSSGEVVLHGRDVTRLGPHRRARLGLGRTYQITNLFPTLSLWENLRLAAGRRDGADARVEEVVERFGLAAHLGTPVGQLAYGQQRRIELALALAGEPTVLLLDEPAAGLGPGDRHVMREVVEALPRDLTVLLIEHDIDLTLGLVDRVVCLNHGEVVADCWSEEVRSHPAVREIYLGIDPMEAA